MEKQKIYIKDGSLVIETPLKIKRFDPYDDSYEAEMNSIAAYKDDLKMGFVYWIDMEHKDKGDEWTDTWFEWMGSEKEFDKIVENLKLDLIG